MLALDVERLAGSRLGRGLRGSGRMHAPAAPRRSVRPHAAVVGGTGCRVEQRLGGRGDEAERRGRTGARRLVGVRLQAQLALRAADVVVARSRVRAQPEHLHRTPTGDARERREGAATLPAAVCQDPAAACQPQRRG